MNVYLLETASGLVAVDAGWAGHPTLAERLAAGLSSIGADISDLTRFLVTHLHRDHYTYAVEHRAGYGSRVSLGLDEAASLSVLQRSERRPTKGDLARLRRCGAEGVAERLPVQSMDPSIWQDPDDWLTPGPIADLGDLVLDARATPGHTRGHLVFVDEVRSLTFTGDHVLPHTVPSAGSEQVRTNPILSRQLDSLRAVLAWPDSELLPAHGPVGSSTHARASELLDQLQARVSRCLECVRGRSTTLDVARRLTWSRARLSFDELEPAEQQRALTKVLSYLEHLVETGLLSETEEFGAACFRPR